MSHTLTKRVVYIHLSKFIIEFFFYKYLVLNMCKMGKFSMINFDKERHGMFIQISIISQMIDTNNLHNLWTGPARITALSVLARPQSPPGCSRNMNWGWDYLDE